jgi:hypothetical protein
LARVSNPDLAAFVVWVPQLGAERKHVASGAAIITDPRAQQYWDADNWLDTAYGKVLKTPDVAWDVYLLYRRGVKWNDALPPHPDFWMHQLSGVHDAPHLDPDVLRKHTEDLLR